MKSLSATLASAERIGVPDCAAAARCASCGASALEAGFITKRMAVAPNTRIPTTSTIGTIGPFIRYSPLYAHQQTILMRKLGKMKFDALGTTSAGWRTIPSQARAVRKLL